MASVLFQLGNKVQILVSFYLNQEYIAKNLCEKKEVKDNCCKGSCQLNKELDKADENTDISQSTKQDKNTKKGVSEDMPLFLSGLSRFVNPNCTSDCYLLQFNTKTCPGFKTDIAHPPSVVI